MRSNDIKNKLLSISIEGKSLDYQSGFIDMRNKAIEVINENERLVIPDFLDEYITLNRYESISEIFSHEYIDNYDHEEISGDTIENLKKFLFGNSREENEKRFLKAVEAFVNDNYDIDYNYNTIGKSYKSKNNVIIEIPKEKLGKIDEIKLNKLVKDICNLLEL